MDRTHDRATDYRPIDCGLHDHLEALATSGVPCTVRFDEDGQLREVAGAIVDVRTQGGAEFIELSDGTSIRLDHIVEVGWAGGRIAFRGTGGSAD